MSTLEKKNLSAAEVIDILIQGNSRFINNLRSIESFLNYLKLKSFAEQGQFPFCALLTCADSRIPIEFIFDRGLGELFVIRNFGTLVEEIVIASMEYAVLNFNLELIVVMGNSNSGAIRTIMEQDGKPLDNISPARLNLYNHIIPSIHKARKEIGYEGILDKSPERIDYWNQVFEIALKENVYNSVRQLKEKSKILAERIDNKKLFIIPSIYYLDKGEVIFDFPEELSVQLDPKVIALDSYRQRQTALMLLKESSKKNRRVL